jgi:diguanylate cyclase (GGDEF)-like protein/PAS domain S-box-containing protein
MRQLASKTAGFRPHKRGKRLFSLRGVGLLVCALAVIVGMVLMAGRANGQRDQAREIQLTIERVRADAKDISAYTWRGLATVHGPPSESTVADGMDTYRRINAGLLSLRRLGAPPARLKELETRLGAVYASGFQTAAVGRRDPKAARRMAMTSLTPAVARFDWGLTEAARSQGQLARAAKLRSEIGSLGSLGVGLALLALLGWRMHRMNRSSALAEHRRAIERRGEERLHALVRHSSDVVAVVDADWKVRWLADSVRGMLGFDPGQLMGQNLTELVHPEDAHRAARLVDHANDGTEHAALMSVRVRTRDGEYRHVEILADNRSTDPVIDGILLNLRDVSERVELERQLRHQAFHDPLTGLANRALFEDRLGQALVRRDHGRLAVLFIDLDDFKAVNDSLGHAHGDQLLRTAAQRLLEVLRPEDTAARLGGDEFAVLLEDLGDNVDAHALADRVRVALGAALSLGGRQLAPTASIGVAWPGADTGADELLRDADVAMYAAKERGKGQVVVFEPAMRHHVLERLELTSDLALALDRDEFALDYQPLVELRDGTIVGVEALLRWDHPTRGHVGPANFIALAESSGLIVSIGAWVLRQACEQLRSWDDARLGRGALEMSVNVSAGQIADPDFARLVATVLAETGVAPERLTLEITERILVDDSDVTLRQLTELKDIGVRLAVDDFGTGYSALSYLQAFPIDVLKVDRSFVSGIDLDDDKARLVRGIVDMGHSMRLQIVIEGIETAGEAALLQVFRSDLGQGYFFARPIDAYGIERMLDADRSGAAA